MYEGTSIKNNIQQVKTATPSQTNLNLNDILDLHTNLIIKMASHERLEKRIFTFSPFDVVTCKYFCVIVLSKT